MTVYGTIPISALAQPQQIHDEQSSDQENKKFIAPNVGNKRQNSQVMSASELRAFFFAQNCTQKTALPGPHRLRKNHAMIPLVQMTLQNIEPESNTEHYLLGF